MNVEHCDFLSRLAKPLSHEQDGETLRGAAMPRRPASGDPAMALETSMHTNEPHGPLLFPTELLPDYRQMLDCIRPGYAGHARASRQRRIPSRSMIVR
jgi:hypothetical protein